jgi:hypothetical protein
MEKDIFKDFSPDKAMDYDLGSAYGCPQGQISSMCSNAKQARSCFVHPACVSIIASTVFFTARLSAAARARRDDCLLVISKSFTPMFWIQARLVGWPGRPPLGLLRTFRPNARFPGAHQTRRKIVGCNQWRRQTPCYHGFDSHAWGSSNINWPFPFLERF